MQAKFPISLLFVFLVNSIILISALAVSANILFAVALIIWVHLIYYAYLKFEKRSMLFAFCISFFVFLMGRDFLEQFFKYKVEDFTDKINNHAYICYILALLSIWIGYIICEKRGRYRKETIKYLGISNGYLQTIKKLSLWVFVITWVFASAYMLIIAAYIGTNSYSEYYTDYSEYLSGNTLLYLISKLEDVMPIAFSIFLATLPEKKEFKFPAVLYLLYLVVSLGSGQRSIAILGLLWLFIYIVFRSGLSPGEKWFDRKYLIWAVVVLPILAILSSLIGILRMGDNISNVNLWDSFISFFYDQGVSSNVIKRAFMHADQIPEGYLYTFEFTRSGLIARILGITVYHGNTVDHALYGGSFTHTLGYVVLGSAYLSGRGTGTSYIAELFFDFGYIGVVVGSLIYSWLFINISRIANKSPFILSVYFTIITQLLWAPRGSYSGFLSILFAPATVITYIIIFGIAKIWVSTRTSTNLQYKKDVWNG